MREFLSLSIPVFMAAAWYPVSDDTPPAFIEDLAQHVRDRSRDRKSDGGVVLGLEGSSWSEVVTVLSMGELLPMSFGPDQLVTGQALAQGTDDA